MGIVDVSSYDNFLIFLIPKSGFDRRHDAKSVERLHSPFQKLVTRAVSFELDLHVTLERVADGG